LRTTGKQLGGITGKGFLPGRSGNPGGRPAGLAEQVRAKRTKPDESERFLGLTARQAQALPIFAASPSVEGACRAAGLSKATAYAWLKQPAFQQALGAARDAILTQALGALKAASSRAVETIAQLAAQGAQESVKLSAARTILDSALRARELEELDSRIRELEERVFPRGGRHGRLGTTA